ncbi:MAG: hypothetical protein ACODAB_07275 [Gemmatimonadota bacterium]
MTREQYERRLENARRDFETAADRLAQLRGAAESIHVSGTMDDAIGHARDGAGLCDALLEDTGALESERS